MIVPISYFGFDCNPSILLLDFRRLLVALVGQVDEEEEVAVVAVVQVVGVVSLTSDAVSDVSSWLQRSKTGTST
jgi:hypothetical protein